VGGIIVAVYLAGNYTHNERMKLADRLKPKPRILGIGPTTHNWRRIKVHNLTGRTIRFKAKLHTTKPPLDYPLPVHLQPTHCQLTDNVGEVAPNGEESVDIFIDEGPPHDIRIKLMGNPPCEFPISRAKRTELQVLVYPVSEAGEGVYRWFYIVPQPDRSVIFTPDGQTTVSVQPEHDLPRPE
jgi:hypothetical protein